MNVVELESRLSEWCQEAANLGVVYEKLPAFLARRIVDAGLTSVQDDPNVTTAVIDGQIRKVRVKGRRGGHIEYEICEPGSGRLGMGILPVAAFKDNSKLAEIVHRMEGGT